MSYLITLSFESIETDCVISETFQMSLLTNVIYREIHCNQFWSHDMAMLY